MHSCCRNVSGAVVRQLTNHGLVYALIVSLAVNVAYAERLRALSARPLAEPEAGVLFEPAGVVTSSGIIDLTSSPDAVPTIVYYFSPSCGWCRRNWSNVAALERQTRGRYRFVAFADTPRIEDTMSEYQLDFEAYGGLMPSDRRRLGLAGTPFTLVVSPEGRVERVWAGAYTARVRREVEQHFDVDLPGLSAPRGD